MADMTLDEIRRGDNAARIVDDPLYREAFAQVKAGLIKAMAESPLGDDKTHNRLVIALQLLSQIERQFNDHIQTGKMAKIQLADKSRFKVFG